MREKQYKKAIKKIAPMCAKAILVKMRNKRSVEPEILKKEFSKYLSESDIFIAEGAGSALSKIKNGEKAAAVGSLYLAGEILRNI
jgi:dihydrofolate synthase/folylpolyglutamate synthase